jgi:hypothetical protein
MLTTRAFNSSLGIMFCTEMKAVTTPAVSAVARNVTLRSFSTLVGEVLLDRSIGPSGRRRTDGGSLAGPCFVQEPISIRAAFAEFNFFHLSPD